MIFEPFFVARTCLRIARGRERQSLVHENGHDGSGPGALTSNRRSFFMAKVAG